MLDAVLITNQPYNSANTLANSVGYAMWNNVLYNKVGTLWKITSSGANYNPCSVDSAYDVTDYGNLRCVNNYVYDSGWIKDGNNYIMNKFGELSYTRFMWQGNFNSAPLGTTQINFNGYTLYAENNIQTGCSIRGTQNRTEYKAFSSF